jgi:hypothetical protein
VSAHRAVGWLVQGVGNMAVCQPLLPLASCPSRWCLMRGLPFQKATLLQKVGLSTS